MSKITEERRKQALEIVETLCRYLRRLTADAVYDALAVNGFDEDERVRLTGAIIRTASARGWISATERFIRSAKNHSNLQILYNTNLVRLARNREPIAVKTIMEQYALWDEQGLRIPHYLWFDFEEYEAKRAQLFNHIG